MKRAPVILYIYLMLPYLFTFILYLMWATYGNYLRLQETCCRLPVTTLNGWIWFAFIGPQPETRQRPPVTESLLSKQLSSQPNWKWQPLFYFMILGTLTSTVFTLNITSIETRERGSLGGKKIPHTQTHKDTQTHTKPHRKHMKAYPCATTVQSYRLEDKKWR